MPYTPPTVVSVAMFQALQQQVETLQQRVAMLEAQVAGLKK